MFGSVLWYLRDFVYRAPVDAFMQKIPVLKPFKFDAEFVTIINAGTIVLLVVLVSRITKNLKAFPVMAVGILLGLCGFVVLAFTHSAWMFILGIAVFSLGEMTAHPKYYSYIGLVAPQDKKAVYMGYAFLYGVFGSLIGSNLGAVLYERILAPIAPSSEALAAGMPLSTEVLSKVRMFWLVFAALGIFCLAGMLLYNRFFSEDTPQTNLWAWRTMLGIYVVIAVAGTYFLIQSLVISPEVQWRTLTQSLIMLALGGGGTIISIRRKK
jgi:POT family proton-dependent oligopeptide transporter